MSQILCENIIQHSENTFGNFQMNYGCEHMNAEIIPAVRKFGYLGEVDSSSKYHLIFTNYSDSLGGMAHVMPIINGHLSEMILILDECSISNQGFLI